MPRPLADMRHSKEGSEYIRRQPLLSALQAAQGQRSPNQRQRPRAPGSSSPLRRRSRRGRTARGCAAPTGTTTTRSRSRCPSRTCARRPLRSQGCRSRPPPSPSQTSRTTSQGAQLRPVRARSRRCRDNLRGPRARHCQSDAVFLASTYNCCRLLFLFPLSRGDEPHARGRERIRAARGEQRAAVDGDEGTRR